MHSLFLLSMGPVETSVIIITVVVVVYSLAKAIMRRIENKRDKEGKS